jgi:cytolysin-activating lysine-acyltransferase
MRYKNLDITAPQLTGEPFSEVEMLGAATWLWMHSKTHSPLPVGALATLLLPAIKRGQFVLAWEQGKPVVYTGWAQLSGDAESRYIKNPAYVMPETDWNSGDRIWILDWVAPFGHTHAMRQFVNTRLFVNHCFRGLYHRGADKGLRIMQWRGTALLPAEAEHWISTHPVCYI